MTFPISDRSRLRRVPQRGHYDRESVYRILDAGFICHVGIQDHAGPIVIPTLYARVEDELVVHGATTSRLIGAIESGGPVCVTVTHVDGIVLARSLFHHSLNYRSAVVFGHGRRIDGTGERLRALDAIADQLLPGRRSDARRPSPAELRATSVAAVRIEEASAKIRTGPPVDEEDDYALPVWAGVLPVSLAVGQPEPDPRLQPATAAPSYVTELSGTALSR